MTDETRPPVQDEADYITMFMSLPRTLQSSALMVILAARDVPADQLAGVQMMLKRLEAFPGMPPESAHFVAMCAHAITGIRLARYLGWKE